MVARQPTVSRVEISPVQVRAEMASMLLERLKHALRTGEWWVPAWWQDPRYFESEHADRGEVERAFCALQQVFNGEWFLAQTTSYPASPPSHPVANMLLTEGLYPFHNLVSLGRALSTAQKWNLLDTELITRLRHLDQWAGAYFELAILAHLLKSGFTIEKDPNSVRGRRADFRVTKEAEEITFELNRRETEFPYDLAQKNLELYEKSKLENVSQIFTCAEILESNLVAQKKETKRVFRLIKEKIKDQLPNEKPGVIIFQPTLPLDLRLLQDVISHYGQSYKYFLGAMLISSDFSEGAIKFCVKLLPNDHAQQNMRDFLAVQEILRLGSNKNDSIRFS
jgi:hypothetical protein